MFIEGHTSAKCEDVEKTYPFTWRRVPEIGLRQLVPKINDMDTSMFQGYGMGGSRILGNVYMAK
jgi:hypothetical protein